MRLLSTILSRGAIAIVTVSSVLTGAWVVARPHDSPASLDVVVVRQGDLLSAVTATGSLQAPRSVDVKYDGQEFVDRLFVKEGDHVRRGQILAQMNALVLEHTREQNRQLMQKDDALLAQASAYYKREQALADDQLIAPAELDIARANYESLVHQREADLQAASGIEAQISRATLRAPLEGVVTELYVHQGEMLGSAAAVAALGSAVSVSKPTNILMTIAQVGDLEAWADVNAADLGSVGIGQPVEVSIDAFLPKIFLGMVKTIALQPVVSNGVTTYEVRIRTDNPDRRFRIGMPANVMLLTRLSEDRLIVPREAVHNSDGTNSVRLFRPERAQPSSKSGTPLGTLESIYVRIVAQNEKAMAVEGALREGDLVVLSNTPPTSVKEALTLNVHDFSPNPSFGDFQFNGTKPTSTEMGMVPVPKARGFFERILGL
jgi:RND family efflux transporter MFP subunit